jgi:cell wall-associated NlpC family hydrolase
MYQVALSLLGKPYVWGGDDPLAGFDCNGLVQEILKSVGAAPPARQTAQGLYNYFQPFARRGVTELGSLAFFGSSTDHISHVALMLDNSHMVEAGGGDGETLTLADAIKQNAYVRIRPITHRKDLVAVLRPVYSFENVGEGHQA